jgi:hypothetical protein
MYQLRNMMMKPMRMRHHNNAHASVIGPTFTMDSRGCFYSLVCQRIWQTAGKSRLAVYPFAREFARESGNRSGKPAGNVGDTFLPCLLPGQVCQPVCHGVCQVAFATEFAIAIAISSKEVCQSIGVRLPRSLVAPFTLFASLYAFDCHLV